MISYFVLNKVNYFKLNLRIYMQKKDLKMYAKFRDKLAMLERNYEIRNNTALTRLKMIRILVTENEQLREENQRLKINLK